MNIETNERLVRLAEAQADHLWDNEAFNRGAWVRHDDLPLEPDDLEELESLVSAERLDELYENEDVPSEDELQRWRATWVVDVLDGNREVWDFVPGYALARVKDDQGNVGIALVLRVGFSFSSLDTWLEGVFESEEEALVHMEQGGYIKR